MDEKICQERMSTSPIRDGCEERFFAKRMMQIKRGESLTFKVELTGQLEVMDANT